MLSMDVNTRSFKTKSYVIPNNFNKILSHYSDIPKFIESDLLTNSLILVLNNFDCKYSKKTFKTPQVNIFRNYNWKYIT